MPHEIERKFLLRDKSIVKNLHGTRIVQGFLSSIPERTVRVRIKGEKGFLTIKGLSNASGLSRYEYEFEIPVQRAEELLQICEPGKIEKMRFEFSNGTHVFEIDIFQTENEGLEICEIELRSEEEEFEKPFWLGTEVTGDNRFYNSMISKHPYKINPDYYSI